MKAALKTSYEGMAQLELYSLYIESRSGGASHPTASGPSCDVPVDGQGSNPSASIGVASRDTAPGDHTTKRKFTPAAVPEAPRKRRDTQSGSPKLPMPGQPNILITSALPYVNNVPHLGNIIGCVLSADTYARYCRQRDINCLYICGTDEYGTATETKAAEEGLTPREVCDKYHAQHRAIYDWFDINFDYFGRTSCPDPWTEKDWPQTLICQEIFLDNLHRGNLVSDTLEQVFCLGCQKFLADRFIEGECPKCGYDDARGDQCDRCGTLLDAKQLVNPRCKTNKSHGVEIRTSKHLFLDLPKLEPELRAWIAKSSLEGCWTANSISVTEGWLASGLKPRCITRDLKWGTPVPHPEFADKVFYVWFDAPIGYLSITANYTAEWRQWWMNPAQVRLVQFMGKDNIPFHTVIFPSSLIGTGKPYTLLHHVSTTEYLNYEAGKFSKSRGVGVFGDSAKLTQIPSEVWRYYLLANRPEQSDSMFTWRDFADKNNNELLKNLGNLVQRALSFAHSNFDGKIPGPQAALNDRDKQMMRVVDGLLSEYIRHMDSVSLKAGLKAVMDISAEGNKYMQDTKPWDLKKTDLAQCATVTAVIASLIRLVATLAEPFLPGFAEKVVHILDLPFANIPDTFELTVPAEHAINRPTPLFNQISDEQVEHFRSMFAGTQTERQEPQRPPPQGNQHEPARPAKPAKAAQATRDTKQQQHYLSDAEKVDVRVGKILRAWPHPDADKLWCEEIDVGEGKPRQIASGLRQFYTQEEMTGRHILVVCNLKPRAMRGFESQGMVLCAGSEDHSKVEFVEPPQGALIGERITIPDYSASTAPAPEVINPAKEKNAWAAFAVDLRTDAARIAMYKSRALQTTAGPCLAPTIANGAIS